MANKTKTIVLFKSYSKKERDEKIQEFEKKFPQFQIYKDTHRTKYDIFYQIKATGSTEAINNHLNIQEKTRNKPIQKIIDLLKVELEPLRLIYHEKTQQWATTEFANLTKIANATDEELLKRFGQKVEKRNYRTGQQEIVVAIPYSKKEQIWAIKNKVKLGLNYHLEKARELAEDHYQGSIIKLASRIKSKALNIDELKAKTEFSKVDANISTILTDGEKSVRAWTIVASGAVQRPHYRYLIK